MTDEHFALSHVLPVSITPRGCALYCCRQMSSSFAPPPPDHEHAKHEHETRLRSAFWALCALRTALAEDPSDTEAEQMLEALSGFLAARYGVAAVQVPADRILRAQLAKRLTDGWWTRNGGRR